MPLIQIHMLRGRTAEQKKRLLEGVTHAVEQSIGAPVDSIRVWIHEFAPGDYMAAGRLKEAPPATDDPAG